MQDKHAKYTLYRLTVRSNILSRHQEKSHVTPEIIRSVAAFAGNCYPSVFRYLLFLLHFTKKWANQTDKHKDLITEIFRNITQLKLYIHITSGVPRNVFRGGGGVQQIQLRTEDRGQGSGGSSPLVRGSGGSCNFVQEISFHIVTFS